MDGKIFLEQIRAFLEAENNKTVKVMYVKADKYKHYIEDDDGNIVEDTENKNGMILFIESGKCTDNLVFSYNNGLTANGEELDTLAFLWESEVFDMNLDTPYLLAEGARNGILIVFTPNYEGVVTDDIIEKMKAYTNKAITYA